ncbi:MAG TPA: peptidoglycan DD-metalloendopeptidase family protein [Usitatibacter sp.]|nr:peptidoglycan DD-metalloendopeptidase family protein [Usitatibacter sp.]
MTRARLVRRVVAALLFLVSLAPLAAPSPKDAAASEERLKSLRARIEKLQADLSAAEESRGEARDRLRATDRAMSEAHRALFELRQKRADLEAQLAAIEGREAKAREALDEQQALAAKLLRLQYMQGSTDRLRLILEGRDPEAAARHLQYYGYIQRARADLIGGLKREEQELAQLQDDARARRDQLAQNEVEQARESRRIEKERAGRAATVAKLAGEISRNRRRIDQLKRDEARLAKLVESIARALAERSKQGAGKGGEAVDRVADASLASRPFTSLKGRLHLPVRGRLMNHYGERREATGTAWKGLFIRAVTGETVRAVADGLVVYADWLRGFGNLLILDHGGGYMSLYANNEGLLRRVGEKVRAGDPIANVGASGESPDSGLYFELRRDGKPFDPLKWTAR